MKRAIFSVLILLVLTGCHSDGGKEATTTGTAGLTTTQPSTESETAAVPAAGNLAVILSELRQGGYFYENYGGRIEHYQFEDVYYIFLIPEMNGESFPKKEIKLYGYHEDTDTLTELGEYGNILACKIADKNNIYMLTQKGSRVYTGRYGIPNITHLTLEPHRVGNRFDFGMSVDEEPYYAPVGEDIYGVNIYGLSSDTTQILKVSDCYIGVSILFDYFAAGRGRNVADWSCPETSAFFLYSEEEGTLSILLPETDIGGWSEGAIDISNVFIESARIEKFRESNVKIVLKLTKYAKYYTVAEDKVFAPDCPPFIWDNRENIVDMEITKYEVYSQEYHRELKVVFSAGVKPENPERVQETVEVEGEYYDYYVYVGDYDKENWISAWETIEAAAVPVNLISEDSAYTQKIRGN